jgi:peptidoglycan/LPS O-acetylase OafA/YrhL
MDYRREIDGLRALALLPVILFHAGFETFSGGFVGVDVFFVISGYLITSVILAEIEQGKFSIINFYERRARRLLPALFLVMLVCIPFAWIWLLPTDMKDFSKSLVAVSVFVSNILFRRQSGYFDTAAELKPLLHTWSLAVEEQYYVIFPIFLMLFWRLGRRWILVTLGLIFVASLAAAQWAAYAKPAAAFYLFPARAWELLIGAFAAYYLAKTNCKDFGKGFGEFCGWLGVTLILYAIFSYSKATPFPGLYALIPTLGALLVILFATQQTKVGKFVGNKAFVGVGLISYSAYLWHQPVFAFARTYTFGQLSIEITALLILLIFFLALLSFKYIETPFRSKGKVSRHSVFLLSILGAVFFISVGTIGSVMNGFPGNQASINEAIGDWSHPGKLSKTNIDGYYKLHASKPIDVLFFGDSHAEQFAPLSSEMEALGLNVGFLSGGGCPPVPNLLDDSLPLCLNLFDRLSKVLDIEANLSKVVVGGCFNCYFIEQSLSTPNLGDTFNYYYLSGGEKLFFRKGKGQEEAIVSLNIFLKSLTERYKLIFIGDNPLSESFNPSVILSYIKRGDSDYFKNRYPLFSNREFKVSKEELKLDDKLREATPSNATYLSMVDVVCPRGSCRALDNNGLPLYKDRNHMRPDYVKDVVGPHLMKNIR